MQKKVNNTDKFLLSTLLMHCPDILIMIRDNVIIEFNHAAEQYYGHSRHDAINKTYALLCSDSGKETLDIEQTSIETHDVKWTILKASVDNHLEYIILGQETTPIQNTVDDNLEINQIKSLVADLTLEKEKIEKDNKTLSQYLQDIISAVPGSIYWKNKEGIYLGCNEFMAKTAGLNSTADIIGKSDVQLWPEQAEKFRENDLHVMELGQHVRIEEEVILPNGKKRFFIVDKMPLRDQDGHLNGIIGNSMEVTGLKETQSALESANQAKTEFIANMSHDIRTPLTGVVGMSKMLEDSVSDSKQKSYAHMLGESGDQLLHMLNGILDVVSADNANENDMHEEPFSLRRMMQDIIELERPTTMVKGLDLIATIDEAIPPFVFSDHTKIHRILLNLLGNAIKFTTTGHVDIGAKLLKQEGDHALIQFHVKDTGIGIPYELQDKVFDRFFRVTPSYKGIYTGHGVGLHIAQSYAHLLGGDILLTSEPNVGTTFYFDLSLRISKETTATLSESSTLQPSLELPLPVLPIVEPVVNKPLPSVPMLLLVEDNAIALMILENLVTECGCKFIHAMDGLEALKLATNNHFDLIVTDLGLPGLSGMEFTQKLRLYENEHNQSPTPVIGLTAHADVAVKNECVQSGMNEAYTKPLTADVLEKIKATYLGRGDYIALMPVVTQEENVSNLGADLPDTETELFQLNTSPLLDANGALKLLNNNIKLFNATLTSIVEKELPQDLDELKKAHEQNDWTSVEHIAHRMKGGFVCCGIARLALACQYLERYHKAGHTVQLEALYQQLVDVSGKTTATIKRWLAMQ